MMFRAIDVMSDQRLSLRITKQPAFLGFHIGSIVKLMGTAAANALMSCWPIRRLAFPPV